MWWTNPEQSVLGKLGTYHALGWGGHNVYVVPQANLVYVHRSDTDNEKQVSRFIIEYVLQEILKARTGPPKPSPRLVELDQYSLKSTLTVSSHCPGFHSNFDPFWSWFRVGEISCGRRRSTAATGGYTYSSR